MFVEQALSADDFLKSEACLMLESALRGPVKSGGLEGSDCALAAKAVELLYCTEDATQVQLLSATEHAPQSEALMGATINMIYSSEVEISIRGFRCAHSIAQQPALRASLLKSVCGRHGGPEQLVRHMVDRVDIRSRVKGEDQIECETVLALLESLSSDDAVVTALNNYSASVAALSQHLADPATRQTAMSVLYSLASSGSEHPWLQQADGSAAELVCAALEADD